jgi:3-oxoacyl-[acyl-carrier-protein] synthase-3
LSDEAIVRRTGISVRHWVDDEHATAYLAEEAARHACEAGGVAPASIDTVIVSTTSPDMVMPSTACLVQRALGAKGAAAFDVSASCSGFLYGLSMADRLVRTGQSRASLIVAAEVKSRFLDLDDRDTAMLFGDGAGAAVVVGEPSVGGAPQGLLGVRLHADGSQQALIRIPAGGSRQPATAESVRGRQHRLHMRGGPLYRLAVKRLAEAVTNTLKEFGLGVGALKLAVFHQANARLLHALASRVGLSQEQLWSVVARFGNTSSASLPIALDHAVREGRIQRGDTVLLGTFGGGLTWATALVRW